jgi:hypothetical protein
MMHPDSVIARKWIYSDNEILLVKIPLPTSIYRFRIQYNTLIFHTCLYEMSKLVLNGTTPSRFHHCKSIINGTL